MYPVRDFDERPEPPEPTSATPGTQGKLDVMRARVEAGFSLFHPHDARIEDNRRGSSRLTWRGQPSADDLAKIIEAILAADDE